MEAASASAELACGKAGSNIQSLTVSESHSCGDVYQPRLQVNERHKNVCVLGNSDHNLREVMFERDCRQARVRGVVSQALVLSIC